MNVRTASISFNQPAKVPNTSPNAIFSQNYAIVSIITVYYFDVVFLISFHVTRRCVNTKAASPFDYLLLFERGRWYSGTHTSSSSSVVVLCMALGGLDTRPMSALSRLGVFV